MTDQAEELHPRRPVRWSPAGIGWPAAADQAATWADGLADLLRAEIGAAQGRGVISAGEGEQLLARLVLVIDQAVVARCAP